MTGGPRKPIDDPKVVGILLAAGAVWAGTMAFTLANPDRRRKFFEDAARRRAENAAEDARWREQRRAEELAKEAELAKRKAEEKRRYDAEFVDLTLPVALPYPDAPEVETGSFWGGGCSFRNYSKIANASIYAIYYRYDGRGMFEARFGKEVVRGAFEPEGYNSEGDYMFTMSPGREYEGDASCSFTKEQVDVVLKLLGGEGGPEEMTFYRIKR